MEYAAVIAAVAGVVSSLIGAGKDGEAQALRERLAAEFGPGILPRLDEAVAQEAGRSGHDAIREDPATRQAQVDVLAQLDDVYRTGGQTSADEAAFDAAKRRVAASARGRMADIQMDAARRGQAGGSLGAILATQSGQDELDALASMDSEIATSGRQRALQALLARGGLAGQLRGDDYRLAAGRADANDMMNRFNASQRQQAALYNAQLPMQAFDANMRRMLGRAGVTEGVASGMERAGEAARQTGAGIGNAAMDFGAAWDWGQRADTERRKKGGGR